MFDHVFVDVDSCLVGIEGIDELAKIRSCGVQIEGLTRDAMNGDIPFGDVFSKRLNIIQPRKRDLEEIGKRYLETITPHAPQVIECLQLMGVRVWLISNGYDEVIYPLADHIGIPHDQVLANHLFFAADGTYKGFDQTNPLCREFGKRARIKSLKEEGKIFGKIAIIGDSVSEIEAKDVVDLCIGFGGHIFRAAVESTADVYIWDRSFEKIPILLYGATYG